MIFPKKRGVIYRKSEGNGSLALVYHGTLALATPFKGQLALVYPVTPMQAPFLSATSSA